jgi:hypothetical protein
MTTKDPADALGQAQETASNMLAEQFDTRHGIPIRADGYGDLWPGDQWAAAYIAADKPDMAEAAVAALARSQRPDGSFPHLLQGSHIRGGIETRWIDRQVYRLEGNGALHLPNGEWVTKSYAPPTQALSALAIVRAGLRLPDTLTVDSLNQASHALYEARGSNSDSGLIYAHKPVELTDRVGALGQEVKRTQRVIDSGVNALSVINGYALSELAAHAGEDSDYKIALRARNAETALRDRFVNMYVSQMQPTNEDILAAARLYESSGWRLKEADLERIYSAPNPSTEHPERTHLSMAECLEVARLTPYSDASHEYLTRIATAVARGGVQAITRFEGVEPTANAASNKMGRKQLWLPTAAEIVQINPHYL